MKNGLGFVHIGIIEMTRQDKFDKYWHSQWFTSFGSMVAEILYYSSNDIKSMYRLTYKVIDGMENVLTMSKKDIQC